MEKDVQVGQLIAGKYRIEQTLGRGGMGVVMAALHEQLNQRVALKFLTDNAYQQPEAVARFVREARAAVQIQSEHVARVMDVGTLDSGAPYMVMEYLRGRDLKDVSSRRGPLPVSEAVDYVLQACDAVAEAHSLGIVHRDLKPSNLFLTERPDGSPLVKVLDFGISKALHAGERGSQMQMTASAAIMGSPQYMSPEQIRSSKNVDARADVWALGTILHELLTGTPAYVADTVPGLLAMIVADPPPPLSSARADAPAELEAIILRCLEKDRERRYPSVAALARALERFATAETKPLVRRISRVLGEDAPPATEVAPIAPLGFTVHEPVAQTNGTWARTGRVREVAARKPLYQRPQVQIGAGVGVLGLGLAAWFLGAGSGGPPLTETALDLSPRPAATAAAPATVAQAVAPAAAAVPSVAAAPPAPAALGAPAAVPSLAQAPAIRPAEPAGSAVRPIAEPPASAPAASSAPRAPASKHDVPEERAAAGARPGKKAAATSAVAAQKSHAAAAPRPPARPPRAEPQAPAAAPAAASSKKADVDLWSDPK
ncbi:MAG TPA: serine/threonine-protein kinase [Polyangiaceae bacterium]|jgi:serine/threonine-protein kinase|nr:serine/threonine-protein kinase [Polyangiaceae bacterium]